MYRNILKNPTIRRLSLVQFIVYFGAWFSNVAIYTLILEFEVSPMVNALVVATYSLPAIFLAPLSGSLVDKMEFKKFMILLMFIELVMTLSYMIITDISDVWLLMVLIFIRMTAASLFFTAEMSLLPQVVSGDGLREANELHSIIWSVSYALGMAIGGVATHVFGTHYVFLIDAVLFLVGIYLFSSIHIKKVKKKVEPFFEMIKNGFYYIKNHRLIVRLMFLHAVVALTSIDALINLLTDFHYKYVIAIPLAIGWINATRAFALMVGPLVIGKYVNEKNLHFVMFVQGVIFILWSRVEHDFYFSLFSMFAVGFLTTTLWSYTYTMLQEKTEQEFLGRVVAYNDMVFMSVAVATTMFIGVASKNGMALSAITVTIGLGFIMTGFYYIYFKKKYLESKSN